MSELSYLAGTAAPGRSIEHNGRLYTFASALDNTTLLALEAKLYDRARAALTALREDYPEGEYVKRLDALREQYEKGEFDLTNSEKVLPFLQTPKGATILLQSMCDANDGEILELLTQRSDDIRPILDEVLKTTFPRGKPEKPRDPKRKARRFKR